MKGWTFGRAIIARFIDAWNVFYLAGVLEFVISLCELWNQEIFEARWYLFFNHKYNINNNIIVHSQYIYELE